MTSNMFQLADEYVSTVAKLDPIAATSLGVRDFDDQLTDYSPAAQEQRAQAARDALAAIDALGPLAEVDRVAAMVMQERLGSLIAMHDANDGLRDVNVLASPMHEIRQVFDIMPTDNVDAVRARLAAVPAAVDSWRSALEEGVRVGAVGARRQALASAKQAEAFGSGWFSQYATSVDPSLESVGQQADSAYRKLAVWLADVYAVSADPVNGVGADRYARRARAWNGADLDLIEVWTWGWEELDRITTEMLRVGRTIVPGGSLKAIHEALNIDSAFHIEGTDALLEYLSHLTSSATTAMDGRYFDIDPQIRECGVRLAAEGSAAAPYYIPPSEDLSRPGCTWYPTRGQNRFPRWWLTSVWYHEGVPGHHLQCGVATIERERLSRFQRTFGWTSGYGEGWALYAERLMQELGYFDEPSIELGYLSAQAMRAARIVLDIGLHLNLEIPAGRTDVPGRHFTAESATAFLAEKAWLDNDFAASEINRYLGLPGQAISYKVGERVFLRAREAARTRLGDAFDLKDWHMHVLRLGPMGLDPFEVELAAYQGLASS